MFAVMMLATALAAPASADRMMSGDKTMSKDKMMSGDKMMSKDKMMSGDKMMNKDKMMSVRTGMLTGFPGHNASGKASISRDGMGKTTLELTGITVDKVPDGRVYLAKEGDHTKGIELGKLTQFTGDVRFPIPAGTMADDYDSVVIWCRKFDVGIGKATLGMSGMK